MENFMSKLKNKILILPRPWRVFIISIIGYAILLIGVIMLPLPGPGTLIMLVGLTILAIEFEWAREASKQGQQWLEKLVARVKTKIIRKSGNND
jgi:uncharacterized protein (TIGR02611 family)